MYGVGVSIPVVMPHLWDIRGGSTATGTTELTLQAQIPPKLSVNWPKNAQTSVWSLPYRTRQVLEYSPHREINTCTRFPQVLLASIEFTQNSWCTLAQIVRI